MNISWEAIAYLVATYLVGAIPNAYIIVKMLTGEDIRNHGSGNVGATNAGRVAGKKAGIAVLALDFLKGFLPVLGALYLFPLASDPNQLIPVLTAVAAVVGHSKSIYLGFTGGKSVITSMGCLVAMAPVPALIVGAIAVLIIKLTRIVSVGSMIGALLMPLVIWIMGGPISYVVATGLIGLYVIYLHRSNIVRLIKRQENRL